MVCTGQVDKIQPDIKLWYCQNQDTRNRTKAWLNSNCSVRSTNYTEDDPNQNQTVQISVPVIPQSLFQSNGWYAALYAPSATDLHSDGTTGFTVHFYWKFANCVYPSCQNY